MSKLNDKEFKRKLKLSMKYFVSSNKQSYSKKLFEKVLKLAKV